MRVWIIPATEIQVFMRHIWRRKNSQYLCSHRLRWLKPNCAKDMELTHSLSLNQRTNALLLDNKELRWCNFLRPESRMIHGDQIVSLEMTEGQSLIHSCQVVLSMKSISTQINFHNGSAWNRSYIWAYQMLNTYFELLHI